MNRQHLTDGELRRLLARANPVPPGTDADWGRRPEGQAVMMEILAADAAEDAGTRPRPVGAGQTGRWSEPLYLAAAVAVMACLCVVALLAAGPSSSGRVPGSSDGWMAGVTPSDVVDGYVALVPQVFRSGETTALSFSLFYGDQPARGNVTVALLDKGVAVAQASARVSGKGTVEVAVPKLAAGTYSVAVTGPGFKKTAEVQVRAGTMVFLETDKPIYKPGQTVHIRLVALDSELKPVATEAVVEVMDAKGLKIFRQDVTTDEYGTATLELPLSTEPNLGVWKLSAKAGDASSELDVRVEEYVLPKYEVTAELGKDWYLVDEPITGHVSADYSFGKPVQGELRIKASRYVGTWEEYATFTTPIDGQADFTIDAPGYVAGTPQGEGMGNVTLDITVVEKATGYEQKSTQLVTVAASPLNIKLVSESPSFKPGLPYGLLLVTETPGGEPVEAAVSLDVSYMDENWSEVGHDTQRVATTRGTALARLTPPEGAVRMTVSATSGDAAAQKEVTAAYSPSGSFVHVEQVGAATLTVGDTATFSVAATSAGGSVFYEVVARDRVVFSGASSSGDISFAVTPAMAPAARLLVYQILPNSEVAADSLPFDVAGEYPQQVTASFSADEVKPGDPVEVSVQTEGRAKVGLVAVDHSVFVLAENRLNLQQVFAELERLYMQPQAEVDQVEQSGPLVIPGAKETFQDAGVIVLTDKDVPQGKQLESGLMMADGVKGGPMLFAPEAARSAASTATTAAAAMVPIHAADTSGLAEAQRVRQFFPETWVWDEIVTGDDGKATLSYQAPDSITTWDLRAIALSPDKGLGIAEASLRVFQPFFLQADLPYSAIRGEELTLKIALYNYLDTPQDLVVEVEPADWFELLGSSSTTVTVAGNDVGSAEFRVRPKSVGTQLLKVTARSGQAADAVIKSMIVEPEGVARETVENVVLPAGSSRTLALPLPQGAVVPDSARAYVALTGSLLAQTINGLDQLLQMPFGCGEQNMILFAPDAFILGYLKQTEQLKPEIQAKAELLLMTGYQRELTYRRDDGSFSAFGQQDPEGSLFLTAFVLKTFARAKDLMFVDPDVLGRAAAWIGSHQKADGSFESVGFVHHQEMLGGLSGADAMTAYVTVALLEAQVEGEAAGRAVTYLEGRLDTLSDPYALALTAYALELAKSARAGAAHDKLLAAGVEGEEGLHWGGGGVVPPEVGIEVTGYATLALMAHGDKFNAGRATKWLVGRRNSAGGFGSTQDTVVALQALTDYSAQAGQDADLTVVVTAGDQRQEVTIDSSNFDVMQVIQVQAGAPVTLKATGRGEVVVQGVLRYNLPAAESAPTAFDLKVDYGTAQVAVDDLITVKATIRYQPPEPVKAGMVVVDVAVPTGFAPVDETLQRLRNVAGIERYDVAGRKVIVYVKDMAPGDVITFTFQAKALYPVRAKAAASQVYSYYAPDLEGEALGGDMTVAAR